MTDLSGRVVGGVRLIRPIGIGGMGEVYLGEQTSPKRLVAVKVVRLDDGALPPDRAAELERRFTREADLLGDFKDANILPVYLGGVEDGLLYLVMEYVPDGSLADAMRPGPAQKLAPPLPPRLVADLVGQVASALQYTHDRGVVHRDVKPSNILARRDRDGTWHLLLADFGIARAMHDSNQKTQVTGTLAYMAPEQFNGAYSPATDQYALAVMAYQLLTGRTPFEGDLATVTQAHLNQPPPPMRRFVPVIPAPLDAVVARALAKRPGDRYPSVSAFAEAFRAAANAPAEAPAAAGGRTGKGAPAVWPLAGDEPPRPAPRPSLARAWLAVAAALVLLVGAAAGAGLLRDRGLRAAAQATQTAVAQTAVAQTATAGAAGGVTKSGTITPSGSTVTPTSSPTGAGVAATQTAVAVITTATAAAFIPTATASPGPGTDVTSPPPAPSGTGAIVFADASPTCHGANPPWVIDTNTRVECPSAGGVELQAGSQGTLACIEQHDVPADAYISVIATPNGTGGSSTDYAIVGFRQGQVQTGTSTPGTVTYAVTGYFYRVDRATAQYDLYQFDSATHQSDIAPGVLGQGPAADFALGVLAHGDSITIYVNGQPVGSPVTDSTHPSGWASLCTNGDVTFKDFQVYALQS